MNKYWGLAFYNGNPFMSHIGGLGKYGLFDCKMRKLTVCEYARYLFKIIHYKIIFEYDMRKFRVKNII